MSKRGQLGTITAVVSNTTKLLPVLKMDITMLLVKYTPTKTEYLWSIPK